MISFIKYPDKKFWSELIKRSAVENFSLEKTVKKILADVKSNGDKAVYKYTGEFDKTKLNSLAVSQKEIDEAKQFLSPELRNAIQQAKKNIEKFHRAQSGKTKVIVTMPGIKCWRRSVAIEKAGIYIPGGSAPLFSTVLMLAVPAIIAGCSEIILCTPPSTDGTIHPAVLYSANLCGIRKIFKAGGAQAIAAMAYGSKTISKVNKIFGPGNQYVTVAKQMVQQEGIAIDMPAGPSEVLIIADDTANERFVAADLLSQAEHGTDSQTILLTTSKKIAKKVKEEIKEQIKNLSRKEIARRSLSNSKIILVKNISEAIEFSNQYAPEHLIIACKNSDRISEKIINAGSVFLGNYSPESAGDYASGTNHVLPTNGFARSYGGISVDSFVKKITYQQLSKKGLQNIGKIVIEMAAAEGLDAHKNAIEIRLKNKIWYV